MEASKTIGFPLIAPTVSAISGNPTVLAIAPRQRWPSPVLQRPRPRARHLCFPSSPAPGAPRRPPADMPQSVSGHSDGSHELPRGYPAPTLRAVSGSPVRLQTTPRRGTRRSRRRRRRRRTTTTTRGPFELPWSLQEAFVASPGFPGTPLGVSQGPPGSTALKTIHISAAHN